MVAAAMIAAQAAAAAAVMQTSCSCRAQPAPVRVLFRATPRLTARTLHVLRASPPSASSSSSSSSTEGKLISRVEIPAFIPRTDLMDQLTRWAIIEVQENGVANFGVPCKVTSFRRDGQLWGFTVSFLKDGVSATDVRVAFDEEITEKYEWVGRGADGFPALEGNSEDILGKHFEIRKVDDRPVSDTVRAGIREFCQMLVGAINKYYAFGSAFVDDTT